MTSVQESHRAGVACDDVVPWLDAGAMAVSAGGTLMRDAFDGGPLRALRERTRRLLNIVPEAKIA